MRIFSYLDQGFEVLESLARNDLNVDALFEVYRRWSQAREGDDRYQLIRRTVELADEQGDIRRSFDSLRPAVDLVENPVPVLRNSTLERLNLKILQPLEISSMISL